MNTTKRKRTFVSLDRRTADRVREIAKSRKMTVGDFMREATAAYVASHRLDLIPVTVEVTRCNHLRLERYAEAREVDIPLAVGCLISNAVRRVNLDEDDYKGIARDMRESEARNA